MYIAAIIPFVWSIANKIKIFFGWESSFLVAGLWIHVVSHVPTLDNAKENRSCLKVAGHTPVGRLFSTLAFTQTSTWSLQVLPPAWRHIQPCLVCLERPHGQIVLSGCFLYRESQIKLGQNFTYIRRHLLIDVSSDKKQSTFRAYASLGYSIDKIPHGHRVPTSIFWGFRTIGGRREPHCLVVRERPFCCPTIAVN